MGVRCGDEPSDRLFDSCVNVLSLLQQYNEDFGEGHEMRRLSMMTERSDEQLADEQSSWRGLVITSKQDG